MKRIISLLTVVASGFCGTLSHAQNLKAQKDQPAVVIYPSESFSTRPLREIAAENKLDENENKKTGESDEHENRKAQRFVRGVKFGGIYGNDPSTIQKKMGTVSGGHAPITNWAGQADNTVYPLDPSGAAGLTQYVQMINATTFKVYNKSTGAVTLTATLGNLWATATPNDGDPIVMYDKAANRWFLAQFGLSGNKIYIAVSNTGDATGSYHTWTYTSSFFPDYLKFAVWQDGYYMTCNTNSAGVNPTVFVFERTQMLAGSSSARMLTKTYTPPSNTSWFFVPLPGDAADGVLPPSGTPCPIFSYSDNGWGGSYSDAMNVYKMAVNWAATASATITFADSIPAAAFDASYNSSWNDVSQPGTSQKLDGIGGALMYRAQWKTWSGYNTVVLSWAVKISSTQRSIKWCELRQNQTSGVWSIYQQGIYAPDASTRWMSSIAMDNNGSIALCYLKDNSSSIYPGLYYAGRRTCDPLGTLPVTEVAAQAGSSSQTGGVNRDGDYSQTTLDPDGITFWHTGEYMSTGGNMGTRIYSFQIAPCAATVPPVANFSGTPTALCAGSSVVFTDLSTNTPTSWLWSFPGAATTTSTNQNPTIVYNTPGTYSVTLTATNAAGSSTPVTMSSYITVGAIPTVSNTTLTQTICSGGTAAFTPTSAVAGTTFAWTATASSGTLTGFSASGTANISNVITSTSGSAQTVTYVITPTGPAPTHCVGTPVNFVVTVNPHPIISNATLTQAICSGAMATFTPTSNVAGATFTYTASASSGSITGFSASGAGNIGDVLTNSGTTAGTVTYVYTPAGPLPTSCAGTASNYVVTVYPAPTVAVSASQTVCAGASTVAIAFAGTVGGTTFSWTNNNTATGLAASGNGNIPSFTTTNTTAAPIVSAIAVTPSANGCTGSPQTFLITVNPSPVITNVPMTTTICSGEAVNFVPTSNVAGVTFDWSFGSALPGVSGMSPSGTGNITDVLINSNPAPGFATYSIHAVGPSPSFCVGASSTLTVTVEPATATPTISTAGMVLTSSATSGNQWYLNGVIIPGATAQTYMVTGNGSYTVVVTSFGCPSPSSAPEVFTTVGIAANTIDNPSIYPNPSSGIFILDAGNANVKTVKVFNVLGQIIYQSEIRNLKVEINLSSQVEGIYFIQVNTSSGVHNYKVLKQ